MTDKTWKKVERAIAALVQGVRVPITGRQRGSAPDIEHPLFSIEVKHRDQLPDWLFDAMRQAEASRKGEQIPMVVLHQKGMAYAESFTIFRLSDILELYGRLEEAK